jgi:predicted nucleotidyltransferase
VTTDYVALLRVLAAGRVEFIIVGGLAATIHGAARATYDVDVLYARTHENLSRIVAALAPLRPYLRGAPAGLPFTWDVETLSKGLNFTLTTTTGDLDLLGEIIYGGTYDALLSASEVVTVLGIECRCLSLEQLIQVKRAAGRVKDLEALAELEAIAEERRRPS